jgi:hypothetical protein
MIQVGCILRTGGDYTADHVGALDYSLKRHSYGEAQLVCFTDIPDQVQALGVQAIPLERNDPGWWAVPEVFRLLGPVVVVGLDTVFVRDIRPLLQVARESTTDDFWMIRNLGKGTGPSSGIMVWNGDWKWLFDEFDYKTVSKRLRGDENWTIEALASRGIKPRILQKEYHGMKHGGPVDGIFSYKQDVRGKLSMPDDAFVIVFHGKPRPHEVFHAWRRLNYPLKGERGRE